MMNEVAMKLLGISTVACHSRLSKNKTDIYGSTALVWYEMNVARATIHVIFNRKIQAESKRVVRFFLAASSKRGCHKCFEIRIVNGFNVRFQVKTKIFSLVQSSNKSIQKILTHASNIVNVRGFVGSSPTSKNQRSAY